MCSRIDNQETWIENVLRNGLPPPQPQGPQPKTDSEEISIETVVEFWNRNGLPPPQPQEPQPGLKTNSEEISAETVAGLWNNFLLRRLSIGLENIGQFNGFITSSAVFHYGQIPADGRWRTGHILILCRGSDDPYYPHAGEYLCRFRTAWKQAVIHAGSRLGMASCTLSQRDHYGLLAIGKFVMFIKSSGLGEKFWQFGLGSYHVGDLEGVNKALKLIEGDMMDTGFDVAL